MNEKRFSRLYNFFGHVLSLLVVLLLLTSAAVWTGKLFGHDIGAASQTDAQPTNKLKPPVDAELTMLGFDPNGVTLTPIDSAAWQVLTRDEQLPRGTIISTAPYAPEVQGFAGPTPLYISITIEGNVCAICPAENSETPSFFESAWEELSDKWNDQTIADAAALPVDAVSGATYSSQSIIANVRAALSARAAAKTKTTAAPLIGWPKTIAVLAVLLIGLIVAWKFRGKKWLRLGVLVLNVGVLGFWCGQFLSVSLLRGLISSGGYVISLLPTFAVLAVAVILPFFGKKHYYCTWVCPYGSLQELAVRLPLPKIKVSAKAARIMGQVRIGILSALMLALWAGVGAAALDYEPFTAFMINAAAPAVMVLAALFVVASCFVPRLWCRAICPLGQLLDLSEK